MATELHRVLHQQYISLKVGPPMDYFNCYNPFKGGGEWKRKQGLHCELKQGRKFYFTINNTTVKCLLQANSLLSPISVWPTVPKVQHGNPPLNSVCSSRPSPWNLPSCSLSWVTQTLWLRGVLNWVLSTSTGLGGVVIQGSGHLPLYFISRSCSLLWPSFISPFSLYPWPAFCFRIPLFLLHAWRTI